MSNWKFLISVLGGFQYGYTIAVMAGALLFLTPLYQLSTFQQGFVTSCVLIGAFGGAIFGGTLAGYSGRKRAQQVIAGLFLIGSFIISYAHSLETVIIGRLIQGIALGSISVVGPMYIAEVSAPEQRGRKVAFYQMAVTLGILCAYSVSYWLAGAGAWRWMFGLGVIPALIHGFGFSALPESTPKNLSTPSSWKAVFNPQYRSSLLPAIFINCFQQLTGINAVIFFAPSIFEADGFTSASQAIFSAVLIGVVNCSSTLISLKLIDSKGRKPLLLAGLIGMTLALLSLSFACSRDDPSATWIATGSLMIFVACFAFSFGPIPQLLTPELFPNAIRSQGMAFTMLLNWICNFLIVFTFMDLNALLSQSGTFLLYAIFCTLAFFYVWKKIPETKGRPLL